MSEDSPIVVDSISAKRIVATHDGRGIVLFKPIPCIRVTIEGGGTSSSIDLDYTHALKFAEAIALLSQGRTLPAGVPHIVVKRYSQTKGAVIPFEAKP